MFVATLFALVGTQQTLPAYLVPVAQQELFLTQTFYELDDGSRAEQHEFRVERIFAMENGKPFLTEKRWLAGWMIGDIRLDDPIKPAPIITKWGLEPNGAFNADSLKHFQVEEFRIERLRWFLPVGTRIEPNTFWQVNVSGNPINHLPAIHFRFQNERSEKLGDSTVFHLSSIVKELDSNEPLICEGEFSIRVTGNSYSVIDGKWRTPKSRLIGGNTERFKLIQELALPKPGAEK